MRRIFTRWGSRRGKDRRMSGLRQLLISPEPPRWMGGSVPAAWQEILESSARNAARPSQSLRRAGRVPAGW